MTIKMAADRNCRLRRPFWPIVLFLLFLLREAVRAPSYAYWEVLLILLI